MPATRLDEKFMNRVPFNHHHHHHPD
ncbi:his operon leader peptide [Nissabacter sp. SGAir0207]